MATAITLDANESGAASVPTVPISVRAHPDPAVAAKCDSLVRAGLGEKTYYPADEVYQTRNSRYWSLEAQKLTPYCIVQPESAADVAAAVTAIVATEGLNFAIRSGGHVMWGASNIDNGVTIDLGRLNTTTYNKETNVVSIGPGCRWADVYAVIEPQGVVVSGGRDGDVGVGGLMTGGGKSWYSPRYGWACDSLVGAEVVLADGRVLEVSKDQHADLWTALKGGSGNFGIVTRFDVQAIPAEPVWAGILFANTSTDEQQIQALVNFNKGMNEGHNSSWIVVWQYLPMFKDVVATRFVANTAGQHNPPELQETLAIPTIAGEMTNMTMTEMAVMSEQPYGFHDFWHTITFKNNPDIIRKAKDGHKEVVDFLLSKSATEVGNFNTMCLVQGLPKIFTKHSLERGGNVMGLDIYHEEDDLVMVMFGLHVADPDLVELARTKVVEWRDSVTEFAKSVDGFVPWQYLNYADKSQDPLSHIGPAAYSKILAAAKKYDPTGVFQERCPGGFKITKATPPVCL